jgi:hypothetical protein
LSNIMPILQGICPICFIRTGQRVKSLPVGEQEGLGHRPFYDCGPPLTFTEYVTFRQGIELRKPYYYCYTCAMPQSKGGNCLEPKCHADWSKDTPRLKMKNQGNPASPRGRGPCLWSNIIQASVFAMYFDKPAFENLRGHFNFTEKDDLTNMSLDEWRTWLCTDLKDQGEYWKGLEVFLFKMEEYGLTGV